MGSKEDISWQCAMKLPHEQLSHLTVFQ